VAHLAAQLQALPLQALRGLALCVRTQPPRGSHSHVSAHAAHSSHRGGAQLSQQDGQVQARQQEPCILHAACLRLHGLACGGSVHGVGGAGSGAMLGLFKPP